MISVQLFKNHEGDIVTIRQSDVITARGPRPVRSFVNLTKLDALVQNPVAIPHTEVAKFRAAAQTGKRLDLIEDMVNRGQTVSYFA